MDEATMRAAAEVNSVRVTLEDLLFASEQIHKLPAEDRDWEGRLHLLARLYKGHPDKGLAIKYRLEALANLIASGALPHWVLPNAPDGSVQIAEPVFVAAATQPLLFTGRGAYFEERDFVSRVLELAKPDGNA